MRKERPHLSSNDFFRKNERVQNLLVLHIFYYAPIPTILMMILSFFGVFSGNWRMYLFATAALATQSLLLKLFCHYDPEHPGIKYYCIVSTELVVFAITVSDGFEPFILYAVAPLISCLYFNKKFCVVSSVISYVTMIISIAIRAQADNPLGEGLSSLDWGIEYGIGLTLEFILNNAILYLISLWHVDAINENLDAIKKFQETQDELITGYSELIYQAHQTHRVNMKRCQSVVALLCGILRDHPDYPGLKDEDLVKAVISSVPLHDIGLIGVPDAVLSKTTPYTTAEKKEYQKHVQYGEELIRMNFYLSENREFLKIARLSALHHHEHWDGTGYPEKLIGFTIPVSARIIAVADELEMRVSGDNEHQPVSFEVALLQIQKLAGTTLDPIAVEALISCRISLEELYSMKVIEDLNE